MYNYIIILYTFKDTVCYSDTDSDDEDAYEEALEEPVTKEGTLKWAERLNKRYSRKKNIESDSEDYSSSEQSSYYENSSGGNVLSNVCWLLSLGITVLKCESCI